MGGEGWDMFRGQWGCRSYFWFVGVDWLEFALEL